MGCGCGRQEMSVRRAVLGTEMSMCVWVVKLVTFSMTGLIVSPGSLVASGPILG
jgi:hypothetical protein